MTHLIWLLTVHVTAPDESKEVNHNIVFGENIDQLSYLKWGIEFKH